MQYSADDKYLRFKYPMISVHKNYASSFYMICEINSRIDLEIFIQF